jgi:Tfp pilus assembly protein PilN
MRAVNLIPPEERRGERAPLRSGGLSYVVVGTLAVLLLAVSVLVLTSNQIKDREAEVAALEASETAAMVEAESLRGFAEFASLSQARAQTVTSLAQSRFDWERVLRELSLVLPDDIWLVSLSGGASPGAGGADGGDGALRQAVQGPALSMVGCGASHEAVAGFLEALEDIDGVTRVGISRSVLGDTGTEGGSTGDTSGDCQTRDFIAQFEIVAAFDEVVVAAAPGATPAPVTPPATEAPTAPAAADGSGVSEAQAERQRGTDSAAEQTDEARTATNLVPGVTR